MMLDANKLCRMLCNFMHFVLRCTAVFQCKRNILTYRQTNKLSIWIL